jgi:hypothetical protein
MTKTTSPVRVPDAGDADLYQKNITDKLPDAPGFTAETRGYAHYQPYPGEDWPAFKARIEMSMAGAAAANDPARPLWDPKKFESIAADDPAEQQNMDTILERAFQNALPIAGVGKDNPVAAAVLTQLARLAPSTGLLPQTLDPATAEFAWAGVRMVFASGGHARHPAICKALESCPAFPWSADENETEWKDAVQTAHAAMGWPSTVGLVRWSDLDHLPEPGSFLPRWVYWRAWIHVLTTLRFDRVTRRLRMVYRGVCSTVEPSGPSVLALQRLVLPAILHGLGCKSEVQKAAVRHALDRLAVMNLLPAKALTSLPASVIAGPWSMLVPDASVDGWGEPLMRATNAWFAAENRVQADVPDEEAVYDYAWNTEPGEDDQNKDLAAFAAGVPDQYGAIWPSELIGALFPNIMGGGITDPEARKSLLDVCLLGDLMREDCPAFYGEYPIFSVLPEAPTLLDSVNQGKTVFCSQYARACVPSLFKVRKFRDSSSAPDQRAIADEIRRNGTVCLDEFSIPRSHLAVLSRDNLASLTTGGAVPMGKVMSNSNEEISLKHPLFVSAKALDMTEDLLTRGIYIFLRDLSADERSATGVWDILKGPKLAILMRLGALAQIQAHGLVQKLNAMQHSTTGWRWGAHRSLAMLLYQIRTGCSLLEAEQAIVGAVLENRTRMLEHIRRADDEGVTMSQQQSRDMRVTLEQVFSEVGPQEAAHMALYMQNKPATGRSGQTTGMSASIGTLARARMSVDGRQDQPLGVGFNQWTNLGISIGDRMVSTLLGNEIKVRVPEHKGWRLPGMAGVDGWHLVRRRSRVDGQMLVSLDKLDTPAAGL